MPTPRTGRVLDFDLENRPLAYKGSDFTTADVTVIAWSWADEDRVHVRCLGIDEPETIFADFLEAYEAADIVTGHYIRGHDLPLVNGMVLELGWHPISAKRVWDTYFDLTRRKGIGVSQEDLAEMYGLPESKFHMSGVKWRKANRLRPEGIDLARKRAEDDVVQHKALRLKLLERRALKPPRWWRP